MYHVAVAVVSQAGGVLQLNLIDACCCLLKGKAGRQIATVTAPVALSLSRGQKKIFPMALNSSIFLSQLKQAGGTKTKKRRTKALEMEMLM